MSSLKETAQRLRETFDETLETIQDVASLQEVRNQYLSRSRGHVTNLFETLKSVKPDDKPAAGKSINELKKYIQAKIQERQEELTTTRSTTDDIALTLPGEHRYI